MKKTSFLFGIGTALIMIGCAKKHQSADPVDPVVDPPVLPGSYPSTGYDITKLDYNNFFDQVPLVTTMKRQDYNELSGVAASILNPGILYMHDDGRNSPVIITNAAGEDLGMIILDGMSTLNPEDISVGPGPESGKTYIYYADIGDNKYSRSSVSIYRFEEPLLKTPSINTVIHVSSISKIELKYPTYSYNAEALLVDPLTRDIYIASKEKSRSVIYRAAYPQSTSAVITLEPLLKTPFDLITSGDISVDGKEILLRNKGQIWYWLRNKDQNIADALKMAPQIAPYAGNEHQGEGVGFAVDGSGYYTNTEIRDYPGAVSAISFYKRK